ncbi:MAG: hypothetical protein ACOYNC_01045 [Bacteroidales bacterium]
MISILLVISTVIIIGFFYFEFNINSNKYLNAEHNSICRWNYIFLGVLAVILILTAGALYILIGTGNSFNNTDHHIIKREGIRFANRLLFSSFTGPQRSYSGSAEGTIELSATGHNTCMLNGTHLADPLMLSSDGGTVFHLANPGAQVPVKTSFAIISINRADTLFSLNESGLKTLQFRESRKWYKRIFGIGDTRLKKFIGLDNIQLARVNLDKKLLLDGSLFVYSSMLTTDKKVDSAALMFFCGPALQQVSGDYFLLINGQQFPIRAEFPVVASELKAGDEFFILQSERSIYNRFKIQPDSAGIFLKNTNPVRRPLKGGTVGDVIKVTLTNVEDTLISPKYANVIYQEPPFPGMLFPYTGSFTYMVDKGSRELRVNEISGFSPYPAAGSYKGDHYYISGGSREYGVVFSIQNLTESNGFGFLKNIVIPLLLFWLIIAGFLTYLNLKKIINDLESVRYYNPVFQAVMFIVPILFTIRWFLAWRCTAFPPIDNSLSKSEWDLLTGYFNNLAITRDYVFFLGFTLLFILFSFPLLPVNKIKSWINQSITYKVIALSALLIALGVIYFFISERFGKILFPLLLIGVVFLFTRNNFNQLRFKFLNGIKEKIGVVTYYFLVIILVLTLGLTMFFIVNPDKGFGLLYGIALALTGFAFLIDSVSVSFRRLYLKLIIAVIFVTAGYFAYRYLIHHAETFTSDKQTIARANVLTKETKDIFNIEMNDTLYDKTIGTLQYRSYINAYMEYGAGWHPDRFTGFDILPHFAPDRNYDIQTYDTIGARYIYAEHGRVAFWLIILLLIIPLIIRALVTFEKPDSGKRYGEWYDQVEKTGYDPINNSVFKRLRNTIVSFINRFIWNFFFNFDIFCLLLIIVVGLLIGLSNTNNFIFLGQDLPIVSFGSLVSLGYILMLFLFVGMTKSGYEKYTRLTNATADPRQTKAAKRIFVFATILGVFVFWLLFDASGAKNKVASTNFNLEEHMKNIATGIDRFNEQIEAMQHEVIDTLQSPSFHGRFNYIPDALLVDSIKKQVAGFRQGNQEYPLTGFVTNRIKNLLDHKESWFDYSGLVYLIHRNGMLRLKLNNNYYYRRYPMSKEPSWSGNLMAMSGHDTVHFAFNKWVNGEKRHVYPFKGRYPWAYDIVQDIRHSCSKTGHPHIDSSFVLSFDFQLQQRIAAFISEERLATQTNAENLIRLTAFRDLPWQMKRDSNNYTSIWVEITANSAVVIDKRNQVESSLIDSINEPLKKFNPRMFLANQEYGKLDAAVIDFVNDAYYKNNPPVYVTAVDNQNKIRVMLDYNSIPGFNPNSSRLTGFYEEISGSSKSYQVEERMRENGCRITLRPGPGSSIKPILYSAIMSQYKLRKGWDNYVVENRFSQAIESDNIQYYAGRRLQNMMKWGAYLFDSRDFNPGIKMIGPTEYLAKSSNLYHSSIVFLGYYTRGDIQNLSSIFTERRNAQDKFNFPIINYGGNTVYFNKDNWPTFKDTNALMCQGLSKNYGFTISKTQNPNRSRQKFIVDIDSANGNLLSPIELFSRRVSHTTAGGEPIETTALDMAFNGVKLFSLSNCTDQGLTSYSMAPDTGHQRQHFSFDNSYRNEREFVSSVSENIFTPMNEIFSGGTLPSSVLTKAGLDLDLTPRGSCKIKGRNIYIYSKTGTTSEKGGDFKKGDKALLFVFTNTDMKHVRSFDQLDRVKVYSVYILQKNVSKGDARIEKVRGGVINKITESPEFRNYFGVR